MSQLNQIAIDDGEATPVTHTFTISNVQTEKGETFITLMKDGEPHMADRLSISTRLLGDGARRTKLKIDKLFLHDSTSEIGNSLENTIEHNLCTMELRGNPKSDAAERKNIRTLMINLLQNADVVETLDGYQGIWG